MLVPGQQLAAITTTVAARIAHAASAAHSGPLTLVTLTRTAGLVVRDSLVLAELRLVGIAVGCLVVVQGRALVAVVIAASLLAVTSSSKALREGGACGERVVSAG